VLSRFRVAGSVVWRAEPTPHAAAGGQIAGEGYQTSALDGATQTGDVVIGGFGLAVGLGE